MLYSSTSKIKLPYFGNKHSSNSNTRCLCLFIFLFDSYNSNNNTAITPDIDKKWGLLIDTLSSTSTTPIFIYILYPPSCYPTNLEPSKLVLWGFDHPPDSIIYYFNLSLTHLPVCQRFSPPFGLYSFIHIIPNYSTLSKQNKQLHTTQQSFLCGPYYLLC